MALDFEPLKKQEVDKPDNGIHGHALTSLIVAGTDYPKYSPHPLSTPEKQLQALNSECGKTRRFAAECLALSEIWQEYIKKISADPQHNLGLATVEGTKVVLQTNQHVTNELKNYLPDKIFPYLRRLSANQFSQVIIDYFKDIEGHPEKPVWYEVYQEEVFNTFTVRGAGALSSIVNGGVGTATTFIWAIFEVIPKVFKAKFNKEPEPKQLEVLSENALNIIVPIARNVHLNHIENVRRGLGLNSRTTTLSRDPLDQLEIPNQMQIFTPKNFLISETDKCLTLKLDNDYMQSILKRLKKDEVDTPQLGCPALFARVTKENGKLSSVLIEHFNLLRRVYLELAVGVASAS